jgi:hypothetical protein
LLKSDIWDLGVVFVVLLTSLVLGKTGFRRLHRQIDTTHNNVRSDTMAYTRFDDGVKAKIGVTQWLFILGTKDNRAVELEGIFRDMIDEASHRPDISMVVQRLQAVSIS